MDKSLERQIEEALQKAIDDREWQGKPFTMGDLFNDVMPLMNSPEIQRAIAVDRITELIEDERARTGIMPTMEDAKRLLEREAERLKLTEQERKARWAEPVGERILDPEDIN